MTELVEPPHTKNGRSRSKERTNQSSGDERSDRKTGRSDELSMDDAFDVLRNSRRRAVISCLDASDGKLSVKELSTCVAAQEYGIPASELSSEQYKRVYTGLYQCHLGRMEELGVIDFDVEANTVRLQDVAFHLEPYLKDGTDFSEVSFELAIGGGVALFISIAMLGLGPAGSVSQTPLAMVTIIGLLGLAAVQVIYRGGLLK